MTRSTRGSLALGAGLWGLGASLACGPAAAPLAVRAAPAEGQADAECKHERVVALGPAATEIVLALGCGHRLVGVDDSSALPPELAQLPKVGMFRRLSAEGVLSTDPTLLIAADGAGPQAALDVLRDAGVSLVALEEGHEPTLAAARIEQVGALLERQDQAAALARAVRAELDAARALAATKQDRRKALFIYARGQGTLLVAGTDTSVDRLFAWIGVENAGASHEGFRPYSAEGVLAADPDALVLTRSGLESLGGPQGALALPGVESSRVAQTRLIVAIDDTALLGLGPRTGQAALELQRALDPDAPSNTP